MVIGFIFHAVAGGLHAQIGAHLPFVKQVFPFKVKAVAPPELVYEPSLVLARRYLLSCGEYMAEALSASPLSKRYKPFNTKVWLNRFWSSLAA